MPKISIKPEAKEKVQRIREYKLLIMGVLIGIFGNLSANVIDNSIKQNYSYPIYYILILIITFLLIIFITLKTYFKWKLFLFKSKILLRKTKKPR